MATSKIIYYFGNGKADGSAKMKKVLGGKGANLAEMARIGIPVPQGFTLTTGACLSYLKKPAFMNSIKKDVKAAVMRLEKMTGKKFGGSKDTLLVSVRSGAAVSMPGMMDTVLNLGLNDRSTEALAKTSGNRGFAYDCYRRFIEMFAGVVMGLERKPFEDALTAIKKKRRVELDAELSGRDWEGVAREYKRIYKKALKKDFPQKPVEQLMASVEAVFKSWNNPRAETYRRLKNIPSDLGTAVNVQAMVFGNLSDDSCTGVAFTRDPATGENMFYGEYLPCAQGEDVVAGIRTPLPMARTKNHPGESLEEFMPKVYKQLLGIRKKLEKHYRDMQDIEFTVERGTLYMLQTRNGKRTGLSAVRIAVEMVKEKLVTPKQAVSMVEPDHLAQLLAPTFDSATKKKAIAGGHFLAKGMNAGPGAACGRIALSADEAVRMAKKGPVVLVRTETSPEDISGMVAAEGILTARGGMTSHAAVVARGMGKPCIVGCKALTISEKIGVIRVGKRSLKSGDFISMDGSTGEILSGKLATAPSEINRVIVDKTLKPKDSPVYKLYSTYSKWVDKQRTMGVRANADTPEDAAAARAFGAEGIGLCRTEHMFFGEERIAAVREMILADSLKARKKALKKLLPYQRKDFVGIFRAMQGLPVTVRLLDPPLHEFLPHDEITIRSLAERMKISYSELRSKVESLAESNPMLGHRGCRLAITYPEICDMQARAIFEAVAILKKKKVNVLPEIMIPLVSEVKEFTLLRDRVHAVAREVEKEKKVKLKYLVGTMIEIPRAALCAEAIGREAEFFSFGTNDLTQMAFGFSRDDAGSFLPEYVSGGLLPCDPFQSLDQTGVGELVKFGRDRGLKGNPKLKVGICGEHGGDPESVHFFYRTGLDYVSCSPYRVPLARLAAAQAALKK